MPIYIFLEAWICCVLVLSNLTHIMNLYLEAITSVLSHWFIMIEARSSQTAPFWFTLSLASCSALPYQLGTWPAPPTAVPWQSQSFCIHQLDCSALSVFHCPGQVQLRAFSTSRCPLKCTAPCSLSENTASFLGILLDASPWISCKHLDDRVCQRVNLTSEGNKPWFLSCVPWLQIHLYFTFLQV